MPDNRELIRAQNAARAVGKANAEKLAKQAKEAKRHENSLGKAMRAQASMFRLLHT